MREVVALQAEPPGGGTAALCRWLRLCLRTWLVVLLSGGYEASAAADSIGTVDFSTGQATLIRAGVRQAAQEGLKISEGDKIVTESDGEVQLDMVDGAALSVRPDSAVTLTKYGLAENDNVLISLSFGALRSISGWVAKLRPQNYAVKTPTATIGIRGTDHETTYQPEGESAGTYERVFEGETVLDDNAGHRLSARPGTAVAFDHKRGQLRIFDEKQLPRFITQRPLHDDRFEQHLKQNIDQRIRERLDKHLTTLRQRNPAAAQRLQQRIDERFGNPRLRPGPGSSMPGQSYRDSTGGNRPVQREAEVKHYEAQPGQRRQLQEERRQRFEEARNKRLEEAGKRREQAAAERERRCKALRRDESK